MLIFIHFDIQEKLRKLESQPIEEGMTKDQRFELVLGLKCSGYIHGRGARPKPMTSSLQKQINKKLEQENEELKRKVEEDRKVISEMGSRLEYLESKVAS